MWATTTRRRRGRGRSGPDHRRAGTCIAGIAVLAACLGAGCAGPRGPELGRPLAMESGGPSAQWTRDVGRAIEVPPVAHDGDLFVAGTDARLRRMELATGRDLWRAKLSSSPTASPILCGNIVVVATDAPRYLVEGFDPASGKKLWREPFVFPALPAVGDTVLVLAARGGRVTRLSAATGAIAWETRLPGAGWRAPVVRAVEGLVLVPVRPDSLIALDLATGARAWGRTLDALPFLCEGGDPLAAVSERGMLWILDPVSGATILSRNLEGLPAGAPVVDGASVFVALREGRLFRFELPDLHEAWSHAIDPPLVSPPAVGEGIVVQAGPRGTLAVFDANGTPRSGYHHPELIVAAPLASGGRVIAGGVKGTVAVYGSAP